MKKGKETAKSRKNSVKGMGMQVTPFMAAERWYINGKLEYMEIPIDWGKAVRGMGDGNHCR